jgi:hypothetical protein
MEATDFIIPEGIKENIFRYRFAQLLKKHGKPYSGKPSIYDRIKQAIEADQSFFDVFNQFVIDEISNGKNRQIIMCNFSIENLAILSNYQSLQSNLAMKGFPTENFNRLLDPTVNAGDIAYLNIETDEMNPNKVNKISMAFLKETTIEVADEEGDITEKNFVDYVWIDIFVNQRYLQIKVRPYSNNYMVNMERSTKVFEYYWNVLRHTFQIVFTDMSETKGTLYNIFKVLTDKAEAPYRDKVDSVMGEIEQKVIELSNVIGLRNYYHPVDIPNRIARLFERALILSDLANYKGYDRGKIGIVDRIDFSDQSGARVNALSGDEGIEVADIYFDTRETLDELKQLNKLWIRWFLPSEITSKDNIKSDSDEDSLQQEIYESEIDQVETRLEVFNNRVVLQFLNLHSVPKEVQDYVLSMFRKFEEGEIPTAIN